MSTTLTNISQNDDNEIIQHLQQQNNLLIKELHKLQELLEIMLSDKEIALQKDTINKEVAKEKVLYGAAEKVKNELSYKLGEKIINTPLTTKRIITLPKELYLIYKDSANKDNHINLNAYKDSKEAEKVKKHLSYKVGRTIVEGLSSPTSFVKMPIKMAKEIISFKKKH